MRDKIIIRRPNIDDKEELFDLFKETITDNFVIEGIGDDLESINSELADKEKKLLMDINTEGESVYFLLACLEEKIVGTIAYAESSDIIDELSNGGLKDVGEIGTVYVLPKYQKLGIGSLMLNVMFTTLIAKGISDFVLDSGYMIAKQIWRKKLGEPTIIAKNYWAEGVDHHIWYRKVEDFNITFNT